MYVYALFYQAMTKQFVMYSVYVPFVLCSVFILEKNCISDNIKQHSVLFLLALFIAILSYSIFLLYISVVASNVIQLGANVFGYYSPKVQDIIGKSTDL